MFKQSYALSIILFGVFSLAASAQMPPGSGNSGGTGTGSPIPPGKTGLFELVQISPSHNLQPSGATERTFSGEICFQKARTGANQKNCAPLTEIDQSHSIKFFYPDLDTEVTHLVNLQGTFIPQIFSYQAQIPQTDKNPVFYVVVEKLDENLIGKVALERSLEDQIANVVGSVPSTLTQQLNAVRAELLADYPVAVYEWVHPVAGLRNPPLRFTSHNKNYRVEFKFDRGDTFIGEKSRVRFRLKSLRAGAQVQDLYTSKFEGVEMHSNKVNANVTDLAGLIPESMDSSVRKVEFKTSLINQQNHFSTIPFEFYHPSYQDTSMPLIVEPAGIRHFKTAQDVLFKVSDSSGRMQWDYLSGQILIVRKLPNGQNGPSFPGQVFAQKNGKTLITDAGMNGAQTIIFKSNAASLPDGDYVIQATVQDFAFHHLGEYLDFKIDSSSPTIHFPLADSYVTNEENFELPLSVFDSSNTMLSVWINGIQVFLGNGSSYSIPMTLQEGMNLITFIATDSLGNQSTIQRNVILDRTPPSLQEILPANGQSIATQFFMAKGKANENISQAFVNGAEATVENGNEFKAPVTAYLEGVQTLEIRLIDTVGNESTHSTSYSIAKPLLHIDLVSITPGSDGKLIVTGAAGSTRTDVTINFDGGFFNSEELSPNADGSFSVEMDYFSSLEITAEDNNFDFEEVYNLNYNTDTTLSGVIKDSNDLPLPGVQVTIVSSGQTATTNASGVFAMPNPVLGDQKISIDATKVPFEVTGGTKEFSKVSLNVTIGNRQQNVIERPIYITPKLLDGTQTEVTSEDDVTVHSDHAPGVVLEIPAGAATFPGGASSGTINISVIDAKKTSVELPDGIEPSKVIALEPSGLSFSERVELILPNENDFPEGMELVILSKNSESGMWEVDGSASVDGGVIRTKPGQGISHFSEVFAAPFGMEITAFGQHDRPGIGADVGHLTTSVTLPSFQRLGINIEPKLIYKSVWAHPFVTVSNVFNIPKKEFKIHQNANGNLLGLKMVNVKETIQSWLTPESVDSQLFVGDKASEKLTFDTTSAPENAVITYGVDLSDLNSGIHQSLADYEIKYRTLTIRTTKTKTTEFFSTRTTTKSHVEQDLLESIFPPELRSMVFVQNKTQSEFGAGWKLGLNQRIYGTDSDRLMIENEDGSVSNYALKNDIQTVYHDTNGVESISLKDGSLYYSDEKGQLLGGAINGDEFSPALIHQSQNYVGEVGINTIKISNQSTYCCKSGFFGCTKRCPDYYNTCERSTYTFNHAKKIHGITNISGNNFLFLDQYGAVFESAGSEILRAGTLAAVSRIDFASSSSSVNFQPDCQARIQNDCDSTKRTFYTTASFWTDDHPASLAQCSGAVRNSSGAFPSMGMEISKFNKPFAMIPSNSSNILLISDTGNNLIRKFNLAAGTLTTVAGNQQTYDSGDGGPATNASLYHPRGIATDSLGNIYVSTERGFIRKIDPSGIISTIAGKPLSQGGQIVEGGLMENFYLKDPTSLVFNEAKGILYVADTGNHRIVELNLLSGKARTIAGNGQCVIGPVKEGISALQTAICNPSQLAMDSNKNLMYVDKNNQRIRRILLNNTSSGVQYYASSEQDHTTLERLQSGTFKRTYRDGSFVSFNSKGLHTSSHDLTGRVTNFTYNEDGLLTAMVDPVGGTTELEYSGNKLASFTDPAGRVTTFDYDGLQLAGVTFPDNTSKSFAYDEENLMTQETNQRGVITQYFFNSLKKLYNVYTADGGALTITDSQTKNYLDTYNGGNHSLFNYKEGQVIKDVISNTKGATTSFVKDENGFVSKIIDAQSRETLIERDADGRPLKITKPDTTYTEFTYDELTGDLTHQYESSTDSSETFAYNQKGQITSHTDPTSRHTIRTYSPQTGLLMSETDARGVTTTKTYTSLGLISTVSNSLGQTQQYSYDSDGNVSQTVSPMGETTIIQRDLAGNIVSRQNSKGQVTTYAFDLFNRLVSVTTPSQAVTSYEYLASGELSKIINPEGQTTTFEYNNMGRLKKKISPRGQITQLSYDTSGNITQEIDPNGQIKTFVYNNLDQLIQKIVPGNTYSFNYNEAGNVTNLSDGNSSFQYSYSTIHGKEYVTNISQSHTELPDYSISYNYDEAGRKVGMTSDYINMNYAYNASGGIQTVTNSKNESFGFAYDFANRLTSMSRPNSLSTQYVFDANSFLTQINHKKSGNNISYSHYTRDQISNRTQMVTAHGTHQYQYDSEGQLKVASHPEGDALHALESFSYDSLGNLTYDNSGPYYYDNQSIAWKRMLNTSTLTI